MGGPTRRRPAAPVIVGRNAGAVGACSFASYGAVFGVVYIQVGGLTYGTADQGKQIVEELHSKL